MPVGRYPNQRLLWYICSLSSIIVKICRFYFIKIIKCLLLSKGIASRNPFAKIRRPRKLVNECYLSQLLMNIVVLAQIYGFFVHNGGHTHCFRWHIPKQSDDAREALKTWRSHSVQPQYPLLPYRRRCHGSRRRGTAHFVRVKWNIWSGFLGGSLLHLRFCTSFYRCMAFNRTFATLLCTCVVAAAATICFCFFTLSFYFAFCRSFCYFMLCYCSCCWVHALFVRLYFYCCCFHFARRQMSSVYARILHTVFTLSRCSLPMLAATGCATCLCHCFQFPLQWLQPNTMFPPCTCPYTYINVSVSVGIIQQEQKYSSTKKRQQQRLRNVNEFIRVHKSGKGRIPKKFIKYICEKENTIWPTTTSVKKWK